MLVRTPNTLSQKIEIRKKRIDLGGNGPHRRLCKEFLIKTVKNRKIHSGRKSIFTGTNFCPKIMIAVWKVVFFSHSKRLQNCFGLKSTFLTIFVKFQIGVKWIFWSKKRKNVGNFEKITKQIMNIDDIENLSLWIENWCLGGHFKPLSIFESILTNFSKM